MAPLNLCFYILFYVFLHAKRLHYLFTTKEHFWTLDTAALTCFRTLYPRIQRGQWRFFGTPRLTKAARIIPGGERNTAGDAREFVTDWETGLTALLFRVFCSQMSNPWKIRWTILEPGQVSNGTLGTVTSFVCLKHGSLLSVPDTAVTPSDNFSVLRMDRTADARKIKGGGVCFMINKKWCDPRNISILSRSCSPHLEHLSIICRPFYFTPRVLRGHRYCRLHSTSGRHELGFVQTPRGAQRLHQQTPWRCLYHRRGL